MSHRNDHAHRLTDPLAHAAAGHVRSDPSALEDLQYRLWIFVGSMGGVASIVYFTAGIVHVLNGSPAG